LSAALAAGFAFFGRGFVGGFFAVVRGISNGTTMFVFGARGSSIVMATAHLQPGGIQHHWAIGVRMLASPRARQSSGRAASQAPQRSSRRWRCLYKTRPERRQIDFVTSPHSVGEWAAI
jgi:hypothetical protein